MGKSQCYVKMFLQKQVTMEVEKRQEFNRPLFFLLDLWHRGKGHYVLGSFQTNLDDTQQNKKYQTFKGRVLWFWKQ